jgi:hypothetical protein
LDRSAFDSASSFQRSFQRRLFHFSFGLKTGRFPGWQIPENVIHMSSFTCTTHINSIISQKWKNRGTLI